jgi:hypothetical protein
MWSRLVFNIFIVFITVGASLSVAGKLYKIVDEQGNVTFSQFPPSPYEDQQGVQVETQQVDAGGESPVEVKGITSYCGAIQLPQERSRKRNFYSEVASREKYWRDDLERKEKQLSRSREEFLKYSNSKYRSSYNSSSAYEERNRQTIEAIKDLRCAISWAKSKAQESNAATDLMNQELMRLDTSLKSVLAQQDAACGTEPVYDPSVAGNKKLVDDWKRCARDYQSNINKLERLIMEESRKLEKF